MTSTFHGIEVGKRALFAQQTALSTTGQNIANANTAGYTRQRANMQATNPISNPGMSSFQLGTGVDVNKIERLREDYLDVQYRGENKNIGYWEAKSDTLSKVEELMNEPSDNGLAHVMDEFWAGWDDLSKNPDSASARAVVRQKGIAVAETFNYMADSLNQVQDDLKLVIQTKQNEVNSIGSQISSLNAQISRLVANNYEPNDLYDQRDLLVDQLSKIVNVNVSPSGNGMIDVSAAGESLVSGIKAESLNVSFGKNGDSEFVSGVTINGKQIQLQSGELLGRIESFGTTDGGTIPDIKEKLDLLAKNFAEQVNQVHKEGFYIKNNNGTIEMDSAANISFFSGTNAKDLAVSSDILGSLDLIAAAKEEAGSNSSSSGNGQNAQAIANIKSDGNVSFNGTTSTLSDYYRNIIGQVGIDSQEAQRMQSNSEVIINQVENRRQSISGVSLDEEMANMIKYQQAYNAAARMVTTMDQCLDKVINGMGRVGL
ncbi:flagellar hook-associated protein FlgK [Neobacillus mesonae]|uniref:flagellar hook-associated protein FlgK n=1 Tax=Neobacillus mesonae TaxID=1193713 RepID=UPI00204102B5|nr:flagellar hook-associated protein FlgK [Neobacillus mesonae]MCM3567021.1 flagellar hook-associated protein FlgK [Neobacillus mesonae]